MALAVCGACVAGGVAVLAGTRYMSNRRRKRRRKRAQELLDLLCGYAGLPHASAAAPLPNQPAQRAPDRGILAQLNALSTNGERSAALQLSRAMEVSLLASIGDTDPNLLRGEDGDVVEEDTLPSYQAVASTDLICLGMVSPRTMACGPDPTLYRVLQRGDHCGPRGSPSPPPYAAVAHLPQRLGRREIAL